MVSWSPKSAGGSDINHALSLLSEAAKEKDTVSSVTGDCRVGEIRKAFLEEVMLELRSEGQAETNQAQRERTYPSYSY